jgi:hypothetical protein
MAQSVDGMNDVEWLRQEWPFSYITAKDVFTNGFYRCFALKLRLLLGTVKTLIYRVRKRYFAIVREEGRAHRLKPSRD